MYPCCYGCIYLSQCDEAYEDDFRFGPPSGRPPYGPGPGGPGPGGPGGPEGPGGQGGPGRPPYGPGGFDEGPQGPPPSTVPPRPHAAPGGPGFMAVDPRAIRRCLYRYTYIWLRNGRQFWAYPTMVGRNSVAGWRWNGFRWVYFGISLRQIEYFQCH